MDACTHNNMHSTKNDALNSGTWWMFQWGDLYKVFVPVFVFVSLYKSPGAAVSNEGWGWGAASILALRCSQVRCLVLLILANTTQELINLVFIAEKNLQLSRKQSRLACHRHCYWRSNYSLRSDDESAESARTIAQSACTAPLDSTNQQSITLFSLYSKSQWDSSISVKLQFNFTLCNGAFIQRTWQL